MSTIFTVPHYTFPYLYKFPGQASDEQILFVTREHPVMLIIRESVLIVATAFIFGTGYGFGKVVASLGASGLGQLIQLGGALVALGFLVIGWWWINLLWRHSIALITTKRLVKFISTTPWNRYNLSLPLDSIVDTGAYSKGIWQAIFNLGTFTARSSATSSGVATDDTGRVNKKYFYIENVARAEDIHHYIHKVLFVFRQDWTKLNNFRPFVPDLKGDARKEFMQHYPQYWS